MHTHVKKILVSVFTLCILPLGVLAVTIPSTPTGGLTSIKQIIDAIFSFLWPVFIGFSVIMFIVAGMQFLGARGNPQKIEASRQFVLWGFIGVAVAILAYSIPDIIKKIIENPS